MTPVLSAIADARPDRFVAVGSERMSFAELGGLAGGLSERLAGARRVMLLAEPTLDTVIAVAGAIGAGVAAVPVNAAASPRELEHFVTDSSPDAVISPDAGSLPEALRGMEVIHPRGRAGSYVEPDLDGEATALVIYTSGTTGMPKGVQIPRRALSTNLDALAEAWAWTESDRLVHALPLFHVHGLVLGTLGPLRLGCDVVHVGRFSPEAIATALSRGGTMLFGVPTMYHRLADAAEQEQSVAEALRGTRLLVSGSAALPAVEHARIERLSGRQVVERYGMTETLMNTAGRADETPVPGTVGRPLPDVEIRLVDEDGVTLAQDGAAIGEIVLRGPNLFTGYLNRPDANAEAVRGGWFHTGDLATISSDGNVRIVGRRSSDLIKSAGYKIGAGEIENALLEHPAVAEAAVRGEPDDDLGERVVAYVVLRQDAEASEADILEFAKTLLAAYKRPRKIHFRTSLPRNAMGKLVKADLR